MVAKTSSDLSVLRRYTDLPSLLYLLANRRLTLLSPASWDDSNDSHFLEVYKNRKNLKSVLALCFAQTSETYHHWRVFTGGTSGVCIQFAKADFLEGLPQDVMRRRVKYVKMRELRAVARVLDDLPFLKRYPFRDEKEFRIVYEDAKVECGTKDFDIQLSVIRRVTLNPWIPAPLYKAVKDLFRRIDGCSKLSVTKTTLVNNELWKAAGSAAKRRG